MPPHLRPLPISFGDYRKRLSGLADECEAHARRSRDADARSQFHLIASRARKSASRQCDHRTALSGLEAQMKAELWLGGSSTVDAPQGPHNVSVRMLAAGRPPPDALTTTELASLTGMSDRGARKIIKREVQFGEPGFYRDGHRWFATLEAFEQARTV